MVERGYHRWSPVALAGPVLVIALAACGGGGDGGSGASQGAAEGERIAQDEGCRSCHQPGGGGVGPAWEGLYGATRELEDGRTVEADHDYLVRAITEPDAERVAGYFVAMPEKDLSDDEVEALVAYIRTLTPDPAGGSGG